MTLTTPTYGTVNLHKSVKFKTSHVTLTTPLSEMIFL